MAVDKVQSGPIVAKYARADITCDLAKAQMTYGVHAAVNVLVAMSKLVTDNQRITHDLGGEFLELLTLGSERVRPVARIAVDIDAFVPRFQDACREQYLVELGHVNDLAKR
jgi:hypothetical protein